MDEDETIVQRDLPPIFDSEGQTENNGMLGRLRLLRSPSLLHAFSECGMGITLDHWIIGS